MGWKENHENYRKAEKRKAKKRKAEKRIKNE
jgi:hypothetical protein